MSLGIFIPLRKYSKKGGKKFQNLFSISSVRFFDVRLGIREASAKKCEGFIEHLTLFEKEGSDTDKRFDTVDLVGLRCWEFVPSKSVENIFQIS